VSAKGAKKKRWSDLSPVEQRAVIAGAAAEIVLTAWALRDLKRRPAGSVRGPKALWVASFAVQPFGPLAYAAFGRGPR
jgi:phospholipase D-like protein